ncbi:PREDICTED: hypothetical protein [Brachybacterium faecium]|nr:PREDICTED: hypothetical protein [Brachybacterium faecium]
MVPCALGTSSPTTGRRARWRRRGALVAPPVVPALVAVTAVAPAVAVLSHPGPSVSSSRAMTLSSRSLSDHG